MQHEPIEGVLYLLAGLMIFFTGMLLFCEWRFSNDGQVFQVISSLLTGISGAFLMRITPKKQNVPPPGTTSITATETPAERVQ